MFFSSITPLTKPGSNVDRQKAVISPSGQRNKPPNRIAVTSYTSRNSDQKSRAIASLFTALQVLCPVISRRGFGLITFIEGEAAPAYFAYPADHYEALRVDFVNDFFYLRQLPVGDDA